MPESTDTRTDAQRERDDAHREIFGDDPLLGPDGTPMERGHGSAFARMSDADKAHFHAVNARAAADEVMGLSKQLTAAVAKLAGTLKDTVETAQASKATAQVDQAKNEPKTASGVAAQERDRAQAETEDRKRDATADRSPRRTRRAPPPDANPTGL